MKKFEMFREKKMQRKNDLKIWLIFCFIFKKFEKGERERERGGIRKLASKKVNEENFLFSNYNLNLIDLERRETERGNICKSI